MINIEKMKEELRRDERLKTKPYLDTVGKLTIGYGRNLDDVGITEAEADFLLMNDINGSISDLDMAFPIWKELSENRQMALLNMVFNLGLHKFMTFRKMHAAIREGDFDKASQEALDSLWARQVGSRAQRIAVQLSIG